MSMNQSNVELFYNYQKGFKFWPEAYAKNHS